MSIFSPANGARRLSVPEYLNLCTSHFKANWWMYLAPIAIMFILQLFIRIDVNYTNSLPDQAFLTVKGLKSGIKRGDYVAFRYPTDSHLVMFRKGDNMVKIVAGLPGDEVVMNENREFSIISAEQSAVSRAMGGQSVGRAKEQTKTGRNVEPGPVGIIPPDHYYVFAPHPDSLDSRYAITGWISKDDLVGKTYAIKLF